MEILKPYHNPKMDILITIADIVSTLEHARDLMQNIAFDTTRVSQSASCIHTCVRSSTWWVRTRNGHKVGRTHFSLCGTYTKT